MADQAHVGEKRSAEEAGLNAGATDEIAALTVNLNFHYFQTIDDTGKVVALRTFDENGEFSVKAPPAYDSSSHEVAYVWEFQGPVPPSLPGFPGTVRKDDMKPITVKRMRELLCTAPNTIYYGCYELKEEEDSKENELLTGYVQLFGSREFFWAEGFPNVKFSAANIDDLQVSAACLLTRDPEAKSKHFYKEITVLEVKDVRAENEELKKFTEYIKAKFSVPAQDGDGQGEVHMQVASLQSEIAQLKSENAALKAQLVGAQQ